MLGGKKKGKSPKCPVWEIQAWLAHTRHLKCVRWNEWMRNEGTPSRCDYFVPSLSPSSSGPHFHLGPRRSHSSNLQSKFLPPDFFRLVWYSQGPSVLSQMAAFHLFLWLRNTPPHIHTKNRMIALICAIKLKATSEQTRQMKTHRQTTVWWAPEGRRVG